MHGYSDAYVTSRAMTPFTSILTEMRKGEQRPRTNNGGRCGIFFSSTVCDRNDDGKLCRVCGAYVGKNEGRHRWGTQLKRHRRGGEKLRAR